MTQIGVTIPNNWGVADPQQVLELGPEAEQMGYDSLWVMDHLFNTGYIRERLEDRPYYHPMAMLSYMSATTSRVTLGTSVLVLPYHNPVELAKYAATLDQMSGGRVTLGVGVGAMTEEFEALGIPMSQRGSLTNECINLMRELWASAKPEYHSRNWDFSDLYFSPKPVQASIPLWVGGSSLGRAPAHGPPGRRLASHGPVPGRLRHRARGNTIPGTGSRAQSRMTLQCPPVSRWKSTAAPPASARPVAPGFPATTWGPSAPAWKHSARQECSISFSP